MYSFSKRPNRKILNSLTLFIVGQQKLKFNSLFEYAIKLKWTHLTFKSTLNLLR